MMKTSIKSKTKALLLAAGIFVAAASGGYAAVHYVALNSPNPSPPYTNWATAATVIQDAVDAAGAGDEIVVTNGTYATGGRTVSAHTLTNRVAMPQALSLRSVNGPEFTVIEGYQEPGDTNGYSAVRCVYLGSGGILSGFTLTNGATHSSIDEPFTEDCSLRVTATFPTRLA